MCVFCVVSENEFYVDNNYVIIHNKQKLLKFLHKIENLLGLFYQRSCLFKTMFCNTIIYMYYYYYNARMVSYVSVLDWSAKHMVIVY